MDCPAPTACEPMNLFQMVTIVFIGIVSGGVVAAVGGWNWIGVLRLLSLGALGGAIGGAIGNAYSVQGPIWGEMGYHPMAALFACFGRASAVAAVRLLHGAGPRDQRAPA